MATATNNENNTSGISLKIENKDDLMLCEHCGALQEDVCNCQNPPSFESYLHVLDGTLKCFKCNQEQPENQMCEFADQDYNYMQIKTLKAKLCLSDAIQCDFVHNVSKDEQKIESDC